MKFYKIIVRPKSRWCTPLHSDSISGFLLWMLKYNSDEFDDIYGQFKSGKIPFAISDGLPDGCLPLSGHLFNLLGFSNLNFNCDILDGRHIPLAKFRELLISSDKDAIIKEIIRNMKDFPEIDTSYRESIQIDRGADIGKISLSQLNKCYSLKKTDNIVFYLAAKNKKISSLIHQQFDNMKYHGFGRGASTGNGQFDLVSFQEEKFLFEKKSSSKYALSLSHIIPKDGIEIPYSFDSYVKKGYIGENGFDIQSTELSKKPIVLIKPGAIYEKPENRISGCILENISSDKRIIQIGYGLLMPFEIS